MIGRARPAVAVFTFALLLTAVLASAGSTLGYDFAAFREAGARVISGARLYDVSAAVAGPQGLYLYPPPFAIAMVPFALLPAQLATWSWIALMTLALLAAIALMPVRADVRWLLLLLAGIDWPVLYSIKLGQVGPLILLLFVIAWRRLESDAEVGLVTAVGVLVKVQPGLVLVWVALARRWRALLIAMAAVVTISAASTVVLGAGAWADFLSLVLRISTPITTPHLVTPGAVFYGLGIPEAAASLVEGLAIVLALVALVAAALFGTPAQGLLVAAVVSQLISPVMWDHYAIVLLAPVAYLLERRMWPIVLVPIATSLPLVNVMPPTTYPFTFAVSICGVLWSGFAFRRGDDHRTIRRMLGAAPQ